MTGAKQPLSWLNSVLAVAPVADFWAFRWQECGLIVLNLLVLAGLTLLHLGFRPLLSSLHSNVVPALLMLRFIEQSIELGWLVRRQAPLSLLAVQRYGLLSLWLHMAFAALIILVSRVEDAHYWALLMLPLIAAGFRLQLAGMFLITTVASVLSFVEVYVFFLRRPPMHVDEYFEAASMVLVYFMVGMVAWLLAQQLRRNAETLAQTVCELQDTRDRLLQEEKLAAIGRLASSVAHEIRNPVAMIASALATAKRADVEMPVREEFCGIAAKEAARLERVTTDFLTYARTKAPERRPVSARETLQYVADLVRSREEETMPQIIVQCDPDFLWSLDAFQMHQALLNLTLNAIEHTPDSGRVLLGALHQPDRACLYVENTGPPVPPESLDKIFEPFFTTRPRGTGLGLPISRNIARAHGGDLILSKNLPGQVRFSLLLPANQGTE
ncbi:MAG: hypothetical protein HYV26_16965 [Candidatus Hydrogenedentes bacterium]|nr:hypothetical protein [Candidatus Hydrogenedentota bacterium]